MGNFLAFRKPLPEFGREKFIQARFCKHITSPSALYKSRESYIIIRHTTEFGALIHCLPEEWSELPFHLDLQS